ncbi:MAG: hypothetical protein ABI792_07560 [bacterium]
MNVIKFLLKYYQVIKFIIKFQFTNFAAIYFLNGYRRSDLLDSFAIPGLIIGSMFFFMYRSFKKNSKFASELRAKIKPARPATAIVVSISQGLTGGEINRIIHLKLQVNDGFGPAYITNTTWFVNTLHFDKIKVGNAIKIKVDAQNKSIVLRGGKLGRYTEGY